MIIACPSCDARYAVDPEKIGSGGRTVKCAKCGHAWVQTANEPAPEPAAVSDAGTGSGAEQTDAGPSAEDIASSLARARIGEDAREPDEDPFDTDFDVDFRSSFGSDRNTENDEPSGRRGKDRNANLPALPRKQGRWGARLAWLALIAVVAGVIGGSVVFRADIVSGWPASKKLYDLVGLSAEPEKTRLGVRSVKYDYRKNGDADVLAIQGELVNLSKVPGDVPNLRVKFLDDAGNTVKTWTFPPPERRMLPGEVVGFSTEVASPPASARRIDVGLDTDPLPRH